MKKPKRIYHFSLPEYIAKAKSGLYKCGDLWLYRYGKSHRGWKWAVVEGYGKKHERWIHLTLSLLLAAEWAKDRQTKLNKE